MKNFTLMFAIGSNLEIGSITSKNGLPWSLPGDLKRFRNRTINGTVIMGRKTFETLPAPLVHRHNIVITSQNLTWPNVEVVNSLNDALNMNLSPYVIGGKQIICEAINLEPRFIDLTLVHETFPNDGTVYLSGFDAHKMSLYDRAISCDGINGYSFLHIKLWSGKLLTYKLQTMIDGHDNGINYDHRIYELQV